MRLAPSSCRKNFATKTQKTRISTGNSVLGEDGPPPGGRMMPGSESQLMEAARQTAILSNRTTLTIGTWNVRTMFEIGKTAQVAAEMRRYKISILGISESRWTDSGQKTLSTGELLLYSGHEEENGPHTQGVAFMLSKAAQGALIGWEAHGPRLIMASFRTKKKKINLNLIQCYAPTNDSDDHLKEEFYSRLLNIIQSLPSRDINMMIGDLNAKIGDDNTGYEEVMGREGLGEMNDNGERFADLCAANSLIIGGSIFPHKRIHKATWLSPDLYTKNQIDHVCISKKFRRSLQDVRVRRGADVASDHHLLVARVKLKLKKNWAGAVMQRKKFNTALLRDPNKLQEFKLAITNKFQVLQEILDEEEATIDSEWKSVESTITTVCQEVLGPQKHNHKEWISTDSMKKIAQRREKKAVLNNSRTRAETAKAQEEYKQANKIVKKSIKADKKNYIDALATEAEEAARNGNMKDLYNITRKLSGKFSKPERPVNDKEGKQIIDDKGQKQRWVEYFEELLNRPAPPDPPDIQPADIDLPINCTAPTKEEISKAIKKLKNGKAPGPDEIPAEALKADVDTTVELLYPLFQKIWEEEEVPTAWKEGLLIKLPKKGNLSSCANYRGITLLSIPGKVFNRVLLDRMKDAVDAKLRDQQAGFRKDRSCTDQIATLRIILEQSLEWNSPLYVNFIDYEKAFDSVDRASLWKLLRHYGVPEKITSIIKNSYEGLKCRVIHKGQPTEAFQVRTGVRQGCLLSPFLFLLAIDWVMKTSTSEKRNGIQWTLLSQLDDLDFADDLALLSHSQQQMQEKTYNVAANSTRLGLNVHKGKTKLLKVNADNTSPVMLNGEPLEEVDEFTYLGSIVNKTGGTDADVRARVGKARASFLQLKNIWNSRVISLKTKCNIFNSNVKSVLLYGAETWRTTTTNTKKIQTFINSCLRRILQIGWPDTISNKKLWKRTGQRATDLEIMQKRWRWLGHTLRKPASNITRQSLSWNPQGKRKRGRPRNSWRRDLDADIKRTGNSWGQLERLAQDRDGWRALVGGLCPVRGTRRK